MEDKDFMKEFNKAKKQLSDYKAGIRKSPPGKLALDILESQGVNLKLKMNLKVQVIKVVKYHASRKPVSGPGTPTTQQEWVMILQDTVMKTLKMRQIQFKEKLKKPLKVLLKCSVE